MWKFKIRERERLKAQQKNNTIKAVNLLEEFQEDNADDRSIYRRKEKAKTEINFQLEESLRQEYDGKQKEDFRLRDKVRQERKGRQQEMYKMASEARTIVEDRKRYDEYVKLQKEIDEAYRLFVYMTYSHEAYFCRHCCCFHKHI